MQQHRSVLAVGSIGVAVKHYAAHWTEKRHATLQQQQRSRPKAWPFLFESHPGVSTSPAAPDTTFLPLHWRAAPVWQPPLFKPAVRVAHSLTVWHGQNVFLPQYRNYLMPLQLPTETNLIVIPSFGRAYISPDAAEFANSRRRPAGGWYFGSHRLRSPTQAAPLVRCTGVVRGAATTACRGPAGESLICSIHRRWSAGCKRSIAHHIAIRSQFVDVFRLIETGTICWSSRKNHCQNPPAPLFLPHHSHTSPQQ
jgi:hypothetical protein